MARTKAKKMKKSMIIPKEGQFIQNLTQAHAKHPLDMTLIEK
jgi:hypothetical protein